MKLTATLIVAATVLAGCQAGAPSTSDVKDLPDFLQSDRVLAYRAYSAAELDELFRNAESPTEMPSGYASGIHMIPADAPAAVPKTLVVVTKKLWKGKTFNGTAAVMTDDVFGPDLGIGAQLRIGSLAESLARYDWNGLDEGATVDDRPSLITDYRGYRMFDAPSLLTRDTKGWIDECRALESDLWLCRSTYKGLFWGHVVLEMN